MTKKKNKEDAEVQLYNQIKENKKPQRSIKTGRAIETKLAQLRQYNLYYPDGQKEDSFQATGKIDKKIRYDEPLHNVDDEILDNYSEAALYVLEPIDLEELSLKEIKLVWENRYELCGSDRVAAEALAICEVDTGITDYYRGWQFYINHPDITEFRERQRLTENQSSETAIKVVLEESVGDLSHSGSLENTHLKGFNFNQVQGLTLDELKIAWSKRPSSFYSLEAATEALARIRFESHIDSNKSSWGQLILHPLIKELSTELEMETEIQLDSAAGSSAEQISQKVYGLVKQQLRFGQSSFRDEVLNAYKAICCITGCTEITSLEAAHILPYSGQASNVVRNSLLLRADIHKLFDRFLISIHPTQLILLISNRVTDDYYQSLKGKKVFSGTFLPSTKLLAEHYKTFIKVENSYVLFK